MTAKQIKKEILYWEKRASELTEAMNAKLCGAQSASFSQGGGSKSYSNYSISDFRAAIDDANKNATKWRAALRGLSPLQPMIIQIRRS